MLSIKAICPHCRAPSVVTEQARGTSVQCLKCGRSMRIAARPTTRSSKAAAAQPPPAGLVLPSWLTPAAGEVQPNDPDKALVNVAIGVLRLNNFPCQEDPSYTSFSLSVKFRSPRRALETENFHVHAHNGVLYLGQVVLELPSLPGIPLLEALNEINLHSTSSVFVLQAEGVLMRHALVPRSRQQGFLTAGMMISTMRQMFHDRRRALSLLRQVVESGRVDPAVVRRAYAVVPQEPAAEVSLEQLTCLAQRSGFSTHSDGAELQIHQAGAASHKPGFRAVVAEGLVRAWAAVGYIEAEPNGVLSRGLHQLLGDDCGPQRRQRFLERLNILNRMLRPVRFVLQHNALLAFATLFPTDQTLTVDQLHVCFDELLRFAWVEAHSEPQLSRLAG